MCLGGVRRLITEKEEGEGEGGRGGDSGRRKGEWRVDERLYNNLIFADTASICTCVRAPDVKDSEKTEVEGDFIILYSSCACKLIY